MSTSMNIMIIMTAFHGDNVHSLTTTAVSSLSAPHAYLTFGRSYNIGTLVCLYNIDVEVFEFFAAIGLVQKTALVLSYNVKKGIGSFLNWGMDDISVLESKTL